MRILITGASGRLGSYLLERLRDGPHEVIAWSGQSSGQHLSFTLEQVELADLRAVDAALSAASPDVVIHAGAVSSAEAAFADPMHCRAINVDATRRLAEWAAQNNRRVIFTSTDLVFDGAGSWYCETDPAKPVLEYGRAKRAAEPFVLAVPKGLVVRISLLFGPSLSGRQGYFDRAIARLLAGQPQAFFTDEFRTPLHYDTAAGVLLRLIDSQATGLLHMGGPERLSRFDSMTRCARALGIDPTLVLPNLRRNVSFQEPRPADVSLDSSGLRALLPDFVWPSVAEALRGREPAPPRGA